MQTPGASLAIAKSAIFAITYGVFGVSSRMNFEAMRINQPFTVSVMPGGETLTQLRLNCIQGDGTSVRIDTRLDFARNITRLHFASSCVEAKNSDPRLETDPYMVFSIPSLGSSLLKKMAIRSRACRKYFPNSRWLGKADLTLAVAKFDVGHYTYLPIVIIEIQERRAVNEKRTVSPANASSRASIAGHRFSFLSKLFAGRKLQTYLYGAL